jgi:hypothetical protein
MPQSYLLFYRIEIDLLIREKFSLTSELDAERRKNEVSQQNLSELESISGRLQSEVLKMDADKIRLSDMVKKSKGRKQCNNFLSTHGH